MVIDFNNVDQSAEQLIALSGDSFFSVEKNPNLGNFHWTKPEFSLNYQYLASGDYLLSLWLVPPERAKPEPLTIKVNNQPLTTLTPEVAGKYEVIIPAANIKDNSLNIQFQITPLVVKGDQRDQLGLVLTRFELERLSSNFNLPPRTLLISIGFLELFWFLVIIGFYPQLWRWQFWLANLIAFILSVLLLLFQFNTQPLSLQVNLNNIPDDFGRLLIIEYSLLLCVWLANMLLKWLGRRKEQRVTIENQSIISSLSGLRYIAALLVFFYHLPVNNDIAPELYHIVRSGYIGVSLFYVLSGFILCYNYFPTLGKRLKGNLWNFWLARFARVYPMYLLTLLLSQLLKNSLQQVDPWVSLAHLLALQSYIPDSALVLYVYNGPSWSVSVELFFYALFPLLLYLTVKYLRTAAQLILFAALIWVTQIVWITLSADWSSNFKDFIFYRFGPGRLCEFLIGILIGRLFLLCRDKPIGKWEQRLVSVVVFAGVIGTIYIMSLEKTVLTAYRYGIIYAPAFAILIFWLARYKTRTRSFLSAPSLVLLGEASYSFYLLQDLVIRALTNDYRNSAEGIWNYLLLGGLIIANSSVSILAFRWYETPVRIWLRNRFKR
ncbi:MAG: acyltransferase [Chloroflexi bacterium]|uniref:Acyltransferase n=1 Tax=Candidatus Chlorohelix allophototropha TaxID=3003348 RepID=A0A8T7LXZ2_9CHLR|nr:acyltransferase [Chloroflexota bacterium]WJW66156.1 acyltransferase [Chloroflexota bacterium L227-S17]